MTGVVDPQPPDMGSSRADERARRSAAGDGKTRVLVLIKGLGIGGAERLIASGSAYWNTRRFVYHVAYVLPWKDALVSEMRKRGIGVTCVGGRRGFDASTPLRWRALVEEFGPDIVHAHLPSTGILARLATRHVPVVYTEHNIASSYRGPTRILNRLTYGRNAAVIAVSDAVRSSLEGFPGPEPVVIENGVAAVVRDNALDIVRSELRLPSSDRLVVHVGNIRPHKGHDNLIEASVRLLRALPNVRIVSIGGEKYEGDLARLRERARQEGLDHRLEFLGSRPDAVDFIAAADVFVNPSDVEGLPVAVLEALSLGKPVVATAVGGVPSVVVDGETGRLVPPRDPVALADAIAQLLESPTLADELGKKGQARVEATHGLARMIERYEGVYDEIVG